jgi:hypothetical protein
MHIYEERYFDLRQMELKQIAENDIMTCFIACTSLLQAYS